MSEHLKHYQLILIGYVDFKKEILAEYSREHMMMKEAAEYVRMTRYNRQLSEEKLEAERRLHEHFRRYPGV